MALKNISIVLKIVEIVVLLPATGLIGHFYKEYNEDVTDQRREAGSKYPSDPYDLGYFGRFEFFVYATSVGMIIAVLSLVWSFIEKQKEGARGTFAMIVLHALWALQLLVSAALLAKVLSILDDKRKVLGITQKSACEEFDEQNNDYQCSELKGGLACGFIAALVFATDAVIYIVMSIRPSSV